MRNSGIQELIQSSYRAKLRCLASIFPAPDMRKISAILGKVKRREKKNPGWNGRGFFC
jgi:hypothetical protein